MRVVDFSVKLERTVSPTSGFSCEGDGMGGGGGGDGEGYGDGSRVRSADSIFTCRDVGVCTSAAVSLVASESPPDFSTLTSAVITSAVRAGIGKYGTATAP